MADETKPGIGGIQIAHHVGSSEIYLNGLEIRLSLSDVHVNILTDGQPKCKLRMSFTTAKTFAMDLSSAVEEFEKLTQHSIMTMKEVEQALKPLKEHNK